MTGVEDTGVSGAQDPGGARRRAARLRPRATGPPPTTAIGALLAYVSGGDPARFQPMNINYGLFAPLDEPPRGPRGERRALQRSHLLERAARDFTGWMEAERFPPAG
jgi:methylenetetrahydrofolate--tRNA-(uracil-5-)-methyltransferase